MSRVSNIMGSIERKVDLILKHGGFGEAVVHKRRWKKKVGMIIAFTIACSLIGSAALMTFVWRAEYSITTDPLIIIDSVPSEELIVQETITDVVPGSNVSASHTIELNSGYEGATFTVSFEIDNGETGLTIGIYDDGGGSPGNQIVEMILSPGMEQTFWILIEVDELFMYSTDCFNITVVPQGA